MSRTKTLADIIAIKQTVAAMEAAMVAVISYLKNTTDPTSEAAHAVIDRVLGEYGCVSPHLPEAHIVAAGPKSFEPHYPGTGVIDPGQPIVIDIYPQSTQTGFWADMTRTVCLGTPSPELQAMYDAVTRVHEATIARLQPGASCDDLQQAAVDQFIAMGYDPVGVGSEFKFSEGFVHSLGHGLGKDIHEEPFFGGGRGHVLQVGDVITIEPGLYYKHIGGVRLEDLFLITKDGCEQLTSLPLGLRVDNC